MKELGAPLVNQSPQIRLQPPPENRTWDETSAQSPAQVGTADPSRLGDLRYAQAKQPHQEPHPVQIPPVPVRLGVEGLVTGCNGVLEATWGDFGGFGDVHGTVLSSKCEIVHYA